MNLKTSRGSNQDQRIVQYPQAIVQTPNPLQQILKTGSEKELVAALSQLPERRCDLREVELTESMVKMLAGAVQKLEVDTLLLGSMENPQLLLEAILHSKVHQWDFSCATDLASTYYRTVFPMPHHVRYLVEQVLPHLHRDSHTQQIVFDPGSVTTEGMSWLAPFCVNGDSASGSLSHGPIRSVVMRRPTPTTTPVSAFALEHAAPTESSPPLAQVHPGAVHRPMMKREHAQLLCQLMTAIEKGDADATATLAKTLCDCSREQFDRFQDIARTLAHLSEKGRHAAQEILRLKYPAVMSAPLQPTVSLPQSASLPVPVQYRHQDDRIINGNPEAIRQAFLKAPHGCVDLRNIDVAKVAEVQALVTALETTSIDSLALGFVDKDEIVLKSLTRSHVTKVNLYFLSNYAAQNIGNYKLSDEVFQCILDYLDAVSATRPRRELMLNPDQLTESQRQKLMARFSAVSTAAKEGGQNFRDGITFISQVSAPRHEPSPQAGREPQELPRHEVPAVVAPSQISTPAKPEGASNFVSIVGVLGKFISSGSSTQVKFQLGRADAPFNAQQLQVLKAIAQKYVNDDSENVKQAAQVVLDLQ